MGDSQKGPDQLSLLIDKLTTHVCILSPDATITHINTACQQYFSSVRKDLIGRSFSEIIPGTEVQAFRNLLANITAVNPLAEFEHRHYETNGNERIHSWKIRGEFDADGELTACWFEGQDITQRKLDEQLLSQYDKRLKMEGASEGGDRNEILSTICNAVQDAVIIMDHSGCVKFWGGGAEKVFGYTEDEVVGKDLHSMLAPARYHPAAREAFTKYRQTGMGRILNKVVETEGVRKDGVEFPAELYLSPVKIHDQWCALGLLRDISKRKSEEQEIKSNLSDVEESRRFLQQILNLLPLRVFWKDQNLRYIGCNDLFARDAGKTCAEEMIGKDDFEMAWRDQAVIYQEDDRKVMQSGRDILFYEEPQTTPDGGTIYLLTSKVPLVDYDGNVIGILGMYMDITERKEDEMRVKALLNDLKQFQELAIDRENTLIDLKKQINALSNELGRPEPYDLSFLGPEGE